MMVETYQVAALFALISGSVDGLLALTNRPISHRFRVGFRAGAGLGYLAWVAWLCGQWQWGQLVALLGAGALFNVVFRSWMNALRGMHPAYISASNRYDRWWMRRAVAAGLAANYGGHLAYLAEATVALLAALITQLLH
jgi:hypothetical protein